jgi:signal peptidase II
LPKITVIIAVSILVADWVSKFLLIDYMTGLGRPLQLTPFFNLVMVWNEGVSFGLLRSPGDSRWLLVILSLAIVVGLVVWARRSDQPLVLVAVGGIIGGALGNVWDRVYYGAVADFFDIHVLGYHWPAFNIADSAITIGVGLLLIDGFVSSRDEQKEGKNSERE